jgi:hypothetical protein
MMSSINAKETGTYEKEDPRTSSLRSRDSNLANEEFVLNKPIRLILRIAFPNMLGGE